MLLVLERVLDREHRAPRLAVQVEVLETERGPDLFDLLPEALDCPERLVVRLVRVGGAELVVVAELDSRLRQEVLEALEVLVVEARAAVERQHLDRTRAQLFRPHLVLAVDGNHADARGLDLDRLAGRRDKLRGTEARVGERSGGQRQESPAIDRHAADTRSASARSEEAADEPSGVAASGMPGRGRSLAPCCESHSLT